MQSTAVGTSGWKAGFTAGYWSPAASGPNAGWSAAARGTWGSFRLVLTMIRKVLQVWQLGAADTRASSFARRSSPEVSGAFPPTLSPPQGLWKPAGQLCTFL